MKAKVIFTSESEADIFISDGGVATLHHNGEHIVTTYYQDRVVAEELNDDESIWEKLSEGKVYMKDWEGRDIVDDEMIEDAVNWLCPNFEVTIIKIK
jgi:hypothetical protein